MKRRSNIYKRYLPWESPILSGDVAACLSIPCLGSANIGWGASGLSGPQRIDAKTEDANGHSSVSGSWVRLYFFINLDPICIFSDLNMYVETSTCEWPTVFSDFVLLWSFLLNFLFHTIINKNCIGLSWFAFRYTI